MRLPPRIFWTIVQLGMAREVAMVRPRALPRGCDAVRLSPLRTFDCDSTESTALERSI